MRALSLLMITLAMLGCDSSAEQAEKQDAEKPAKQPEGGAPMAKDSAWTWGYFFAAPDKASVEEQSGGRKQSVTLYRVDKIVAIRGEAGVSIKPGSTLVRVETAAKLPVTGGKSAELLLQGVPQHLEYMSRRSATNSARVPSFRRPRTRLPS